MTELADELRWLDRIGPVAAHHGARLADARVLAGRRVAFWTAIVPNAVPLVAPVRRSGAEVFVGPCHPTSTDARVVDHLGGLGCEAHGHAAMDAAEVAAALGALVAFAPDVVVSTGGDAILACERSGLRPAFCLEGTGTGIAKLRGVPLSVPVWDWNGIALKDRIEHRYHVADGVWPAFMATTGLSLLGRTVTVLGFGAVGEGIAERARSFGARTVVVEPDTLRRTRASFAGHVTAALHEALAQADVVVTATGRDGVIGADDFAHLKDGAILCNAGHSPLEIDVPSLRAAGTTNRIKESIDLHRVGDREVVMLAGGGVLNLSTPYGPFANDVWDIFNGLILTGLAQFADAPPPPPGLHPFPDALAAEVLETFETWRRR